MRDGVLEAVPAGSKEASLESAFRDRVVLAREDIVYTACDLVEGGFFLRDVHVCGLRMGWWQKDL